MTSYEEGQAARQAGDLPEAERLWLLAAEAGDVRAANDLGVLLADQDRIPGAEQAWSLAAAAGDPKAISNLAKLAEQRDDLAGAERLWRRAAELGDRDGAYGVGWLLYKRGEHEPAERWLRAAARDGQTDAAVTLAALLSEQGQADEATEILRLAAGQGHTGAAKNLALLLLVSSGFDSEVDGWLRIAAETGDAECAMHLAAAWAEHDPEQAVHWLQAAAVGGYPGAAGALAELSPEPADPNRAGTGEADDAELSWRADALAGDPVAAYHLAGFYHDRGDLDAAEPLWLTAAMAGLADAAYYLAVLYEKRADAEAAQYWMRNAAEGGNVRAQADLGQDLLLNDGNPDEAEPWLICAAAQGSVPATCDLGTLLAGRGEIDEAAELWMHAAQAGDPWAAGQLARLCQDRGDLAGAARWGAMAARADATPDSTIVAPAPAAEERAARLAG